MIIVVANHKGGCGKTTVCANLAKAIEQQSKRVLLVDMDSQGNLTKTFLKTIPPETALNIFEGKDITPSKTFWLDIDIIPADITLSTMTARMASDFDLLFKLRDYLKTKTEYDITIIDTPPSLQHLSLSSFIAANHLIIPISTNFYSLQGTNDLLDAYKKVQSRLNTELKFLGVVATIHDGRTVLGKEILSEIFKKFNGKCFNSVIPKSIKVEEAQVQRRTVVDLYPQSDVAIQFVNLATEILQRVQE